MFKEEESKRTKWRRSSDLSCRSCWWGRWWMVKFNGMRGKRRSVLSEACRLAVVKAEGEGASVTYTCDNSNENWRDIS